MKKLFFTLICTVSFMLFAIAQNKHEKIGIAENGGFKITSSLKKIKLNWAKLLEMQKMDTEIRNFEIRSGIDSGRNNITFYYLLGSNENRTTRVATLLDLKNDRFYLAKDNPKAPSGTIICSGCSGACNPMLDNLVWYCNEGCGAECIKSVTVQTQ